MTPLLALVCGILLISINPAAAVADNGTGPTSAGTDDAGYIVLLKSHFGVQASGPQLTAILDSTEWGPVLRNAADLAAYGDTIEHPSNIGADTEITIINGLLSNIATAPLAPFAKVSAVVSVVNYATDLLNATSTPGYSGTSPLEQVGALRGLSTATDVFNAIHGGAKPLSGWLSSISDVQQYASWTIVPSREGEWRNLITEYVALRANLSPSAAMSALTASPELKDYWQPTMDNLLLRGFLVPAQFISPDQLSFALEEAHQAVLYATDAGTQGGIGAFFDFLAETQVYSGLVAVQSGPFTITLVNSGTSQLTDIHLMNGGSDFANVAALGKADQAQIYDPPGYPLSSGGTISFSVDGGIPITQDISTIAKEAWVDGATSTQTAPKTYQFQTSNLVLGSTPNVTGHWNFGDGYSSDDWSPTHVYACPGTFTATFSLSSTDGSSLPAVNTVVPITSGYSFGWSMNGGADSIAPGDQANFSPTGVIQSTDTSISWNFGDSPWYAPSTVSGFSPAHTFSGSAVRTVSATYYDSNRCSTTVTKAISVGTSTDWVQLPTDDVTGTLRLSSAVAGYWADSTVVIDKGASLTFSGPVQIRSSAVLLFNVKGQLHLPGGRITTSGDPTASQPPNDPQLAAVGARFEAIHASPGSIIDVANVEADLMTTFIESNGSASVSVAGSTLKNSNQGIVASDFNSMKISTTTFNGTSPGLSLAGSGTASLVSDTFVGGGVGVQASNYVSLTMTNSTFDHLTYAAALSGRAWGASITGSQVDGSGGAIWLTGSSSIGLTHLASNLPYAVLSAVSVPVGSSVVIDPGVVVKVSGSRSDPTVGFSVAGQLRVAGSAVNPVVVTSLADDSVGGDSNLDGNTVPVASDWSFVPFGISGSGQVAVDHATQLGGSYLAAAIPTPWYGFGTNAGDGGSVSVTNSDITANQAVYSTVNLASVHVANSTFHGGNAITLQGAANATGVNIQHNSFLQVSTAISLNASIVDSPTVAISNNDFSGSTTGVSAPSTVNATENWWGDPSGPGVNQAAAATAAVKVRPWCLDQACDAFSADPATAILFNGPPLQQLTVGQLSATSTFLLVARDQSNVVISQVKVDLAGAATFADGSISAIVTSKSNGLVEVPAILPSHLAGTVHLSAHSGELSSTMDIPVVAGAPTSITTSTGGGESLVPGDVTSGYSVAVTDQYGNPVAVKSASFEIVGAATFRWAGSSAIAVTDSSGIATSPSIVAMYPGQVTVTATVDNLSVAFLTAKVTGVLTTALPSITGSVQVGSPLTVATGSWGPSPVTFDFQWQRNGVAIGGATHETYVPTAADVDSVLTVQVTGSEDHFTTVSLTSPPTGIVLAGIITTGPVTLAGDPTVGQVLTAQLGTWVPDSLSLTYQWSRNGATISNATTATYLLTNDDAGFTITSTVGASAAGYVPTTVTSPLTGLVRGGILTAPTPTISGTTSVGQTLTASVGAWGPNNVNLAYQWNLNGVPISGANAPTYLPSNADAGSTVTVTVTGSESGFLAVPVTSLPTAMITGGSLTSTLPLVSGNVVVGQTLTAVPGEWGPGPVGLTYQWNANGQPIPGATANTFVPSNADTGISLTVTVTGSEGGFTTTSQTSPLTSPVDGGILNTSTPTLSNDPRVGQAVFASPGGWGPGIVNLTYQWNSNGLPIIGATSDSYTPLAADAGAVLSVTVTGSEPYFQAATSTSVASLISGGTLTIATPTIVGSPTVGTTVTASAGTWGPSGVLLAYQWNLNGTPIVGATAPTYSPLNADAGSTLTVTVLGSKLGYASASTTSTSTGMITGGTLTTSVPTISGTTSVGQVLTATAGMWGPGNVNVTYQWNRGGAPVPGATSNTYAITPADVNGTMTVSVTGVRSGFLAASVTSSATPPITAGTLTSVTPTLSTVPALNKQVSAVTGTWGPGTVTFAIQWRRNGAALAGATAAVYTPVLADVGTQLTVTITGTELGYVSTSSTSTAVTVLGGTLSSVVPTISGSPLVGQLLTANPGTWGPSPVALTYQWNLNGSPITGALYSTFTIPNSDAGSTLTVRVVGTKNGYTTASKVSSATPLITGGVLTTSTPTISGSAVVGMTVTASAGAWGPGTVSLAYQWKRAGIAITGATSPSYVLRNTDAGSTVRVSITGARTGFTSATKTSPPTAMVTGGTLLKVVPTVSGTATVGQTLTAVSGTWGPAPVTLTYQWNSNGAPISGATAVKFTILNADAGTSITVSVIGSKSGFTTVSATSQPTPMVTGGTLTAPTPMINGIAQVGQTLIVTNGVWGPGVVTLTYQWKRGGVAIAGATSATYKLSSADSGSRITITINGSEAGFTPATKTSAPTAAVV